MSDAFWEESIRATIVAGIGVFGVCLGAWQTHRQQHRASTERAFFERLERVYLLRQKLFSEHQDWIESFVLASRSQTIKAWADQNSWKGETMTSVKMIIELYNKSLKKKLEEVASEHGKLKEKFFYIKNKIRDEGDMMHEESLVVELLLRKDELRRKCDCLRDAIVVAAENGR